MLSLQRRVEERYYAKALEFAQDLGDAIRAGIATIPEKAEAPQNRLEGTDSAGRNQFADIRERRKLGKRILKAVQPLLETALRVESEISGKPFSALQTELEARIESSLDVQQTSVIAQDGEAAGDDELGTIRVDASLPSEIRVRAANEPEKTESWNGDAMDMDAGGSVKNETNASTAGAADGDSTADVEMTDATNPDEGLADSVEVSQTPPTSNGYGSASLKRGGQDGPPTPPQSNGSLGKDRDPLSDGGVLWYLQAFEPHGTTVVDELDSPPKDDMGMLSEDLTDLDDEELKALGAEVDGAISGRVPATDKTSSPTKSKAGKVAAKRRTSARRR